MSYQPSLFDVPPSAIADTPASSDRQERHISLPDGEMSYYPDWLSDSPLSHLAATLYNDLKQQIAWEQTEIFLYGKKMRIPRLNAWYADPQCGYTYSGKYFEPLPWLPLLLEIKSAVEQTVKPLLDKSALKGEGYTTLQGEKLKDEALKGDTKEIFNSVLVNCYRDGQDSVAWHSDDEPELGKNPIVASISLGADRQFQLRHKCYRQFDKSEQYRRNMYLSNGDLLLMHGPMQHHWQHQIPKTKKVVGERINITFRQIKHPKSV